MTVRRLTLILCAGMALCLQACGPADGDPGAGGVTAADAKALDEAAQKLDDRDKAAVEGSK